MTEIEDPIYGGDNNNNNDKNHQNNNIYLEYVLHHRQNISFPFMENSVFDCFMLTDIEAEHGHVRRINERFLACH